MTKLLAAGGISTVLIGLVLLIMPVGHIPLLDANRAVLVESERGGFCAGDTYAETQGYGSDEAMADCMETNTLDNTIDLTRVQPAFCVGIIQAGLPIEQSECEAIMDGQQYWATAKGQLTNSWNARFPYPLSALGTAAVQPNQSRTGDRDTNDREGFGR